MKIASPLPLAEQRDPLSFQVIPEVQILHSMIATTIIELLFAIITTIAELPAAASEIKQPHGISG